MHYFAGQKFPSKTLDVSMTAVVYFSETASTPPSSAEELFCIGQNGYAQVSLVVVHVL